MKVLIFLLQKEFLQILRNKAMLPVIFVMPFVQLTILPLAANYEMKNISVAIVDGDRSMYSQRLINKITSSNYFIPTGYFMQYSGALEQVEKDQADAIIEIPAGFESNLTRNNKATVSISANGISGQMSGIAAAYLNIIVKDFNADIRAPLFTVRVNPQPVIEITSANWFNPHMQYKYFMVPGVLVIMVTMVGFLLTTLNIVREKEMGTIEQMNVSPVKKPIFILSKLIPFWVLGLVVLTIGLGIAYFIYGIVPVGNPFVVYAFAGVYLVALLGLGLLMSTFAETQQQAMFIAYFCMTTFILLGGLFASIDNMPDWAQVITWFNPLSYFIDLIRMVGLKGSTFSDVSGHFMKMIGFAIVFNGLAIWNYKKSS